jgi:hypothetical protein
MFVNATVVPILPIMVVVTAGQALQWPIAQAANGVIRAPNPEMDRGG